MLVTITELAREKSSDKRRELLGRVADLFFDGSELHTEHEAVLFRDIVVKMLKEVNEDGRTEFSEKVAPEQRLPRDVALQLAQDEVHIAGPLLQHSPVLSDEDFVEFTQTLSPAHMESIAQRESLSGLVTDALIENGTREVWHKVSQNRGAEITSKGFTTLATNADGDQVLQANLAARPDITEEAARHLLPLLPEQDKQKLAELFANNADFAGQLMDEAQRTAVATRLAGRKGRIEAKLLISEVKEGTRDLSEALFHLTDGDRTSDIILFLAAIVDMDEPMVSNAFYQELDEPITILCKSIDVSVDAFTRVMSLRCGKIGQPLSVAGQAVARYKAMDIATAQRAMRFVQMRKGLAAG